jgi:hypothetical protein
MANQNQKQPEQDEQHNKQRDQERIAQERPSHLNQGNQAFRPDQKNQNPDECRENQGQPVEDRSRKAS